MKKEKGELTYKIYLETADLIFTEAEIAALTFTEAEIAALTFTEAEIAEFDKLLKESEGGYFDG